MVKGIQKRVIVVKSPDPRLFEQAIFIMKETPFADGVSAEQILQEAQVVADQYVKRHRPVGKFLAFIPAPVWVAIGALLASLGWCLMMMT